MRERTARVLRPSLTWRSLFLVRDFLPPLRLLAAADLRLRVFVAVGWVRQWHAHLGHVDLRVDAHGATTAGGRGDSDGNGRLLRTKFEI